MINFEVWNSETNLYWYNNVVWDTTKINA